MADDPALRRARLRLMKRTANTSFCNSATFPKSSRRSPESLMKQSQASQDSRRQGGKRRSRKYVYFFGNGKADGNRTMKDLLGGKGAGLAEMTNAGLPVPPGFTISTDVCTIYYKRQAARCRPRSTSEMLAHLKKLEKAAGATLGSTDEPAARVGAIGREVLDARHDGHDPQPRPERRHRRGPEGADAATAGSPSTATAASSRCSATSCSRFRKDDVRARARRGEEGARRQARHRPRRGGAARGRRRATRRSCRRRPASAFPAGSARAAATGARRRVPVVDEPAREGIPPHLRHPRSHRHGRQRADDGVRQHRRPLGHRRRLHAQPGHRREGVLRRVPDQRAGRGRRRRHPHAAADPRARDR